MVKEKKEVKKFLGKLEELITEQKPSKEDCEIGIEMLKRARLKAMKIITK